MIVDQENMQSAIAKSSVNNLFKDWTPFNAELCNLKIIWTNCMVYCATKRAHKKLSEVISIWAPMLISHSFDVNYGLIMMRAGGGGKGGIEHEENNEKMCQFNQFYYTLSTWTTNYRLSMKRGGGGEVDIQYEKMKWKMWRFDQFWW